MVVSSSSCWYTELWGLQFPCKILPSHSGLPNELRGLPGHSQATAVLLVLHLALAVLPFLAGLLVGQSAQLGLIACSTIQTLELRNNSGRPRPLPTLISFFALLLFLCLAAEIPVQWMFPLMGTTTKSFSMLTLNREVRETSSESQRISGDDITCLCRPR